jgi:L-lactate dehydrogenase complex protein LldG
VHAVQNGRPLSAVPFYLDCFGKVHDRTSAVYDLLSTFESNARDAAADVFVTDRSPAQVRSALQELTKDASSIVLGAGEFLVAETLQALRQIPGVILQPTDEQLSTAPIGVSDTFAGVASTGSVCIAMGPPLVAAASLLMPLHIAILSADRIVARPRDLFNPAYLDGEGLRRNLVFVTGPSATADMGPLVRGVHGPHRLQILVLR